MKLMFKRTAACMTALAVGMSMGNVASATPSTEVITPHTSVAQNGNEITVTPDQLSEEDRNFLMHVGNAGEVFVEEDGKIALSVSDETLKNKYDFTDDEVQRLHADVLGKSVNQTLNKYGYYANRVTVDGSSVCFSRQDLLYGAGAAIVAAAEVGPVAIAAALEAAASVLSGPVGAIIGGILLLASAPSLIEIGGRAVTAVATNRGLKIGSRWDYPPVYADYC